MISIVGNFMYSKYETATEHSMRRTSVGQVLVIRVCLSRVSKVQAFLVGGSSSVVMIKPL